MLRYISVCLLLALVPSLRANDLPFLQVAADEQGFVEDATNKPLIPWGFNYDHDEKGPAD